ncbi:MAG: AAA family ATPase [Phycisphaerae bacterium]
MIYEFTVENFRSFGEAQTLSLIKGKERKKTENLIPALPGFPQTVRVAAIFGHNASGKSNFLLAGEVFVNIIRQSAGMIFPGNQIPGIVPHRLSERLAAAPTRFEIVLPSSSGRVFRYSFSALPQRIAEEKLIEELPSNRQRPIFTRYTDTENRTTVEFHGEKDFESVACEQIRKFTRETALVLSSGANINVPVLRDIYELITARSLFLHFSPLQIDQSTYLARLINDDAPLTQQLQAFLRDADIGIESIRIPQASPPTEAQTAALEEQLRPIHGDNARQAALQFIEASTRRQVRSVHKSAQERGVEFDWGDESSGTQLFAVLFCIFARAAQKGLAVIVDELGTNIHPLLLERLISWFQNPRHNSAAQLIFSTHYSQLLTPRLLRKDQIWFTEKNSAGESRLSCLADFRGKNAPRSTEAFERNYLAGEYGAIADFGPYLAGVPYEGRGAAPEGANVSTEEAPKP